MKRKRLLLVFLMLCLAFAMLAACGSPAEEPGTDSAGTQKPPAGETHEPVTILLAAAASLENVFAGDLIPAFQTEYNWITVEGTYDSSGKLQTQIEEGLTADVFFSAATKQMAALTDQGLVDSASVVNLLENDVVLIVPKGSSQTVTGFEDITKANAIAIGDPASVPAGQYAQEVFTSLGSWEAVQAKATLGTNVTEVLSWVAEASADAGVVYATDAASNDQVEVLASAPAGSLAEPVTYPVGIIAGTANREAADAFMTFLQGDTAKQIFEKYGFTVK